MRRKDIPLDFTSLLDIALVLLFFFIMASSFDINKAKTEIAQEKAEVAQAEQAALEKEKEYNAKIDMAMELSADNGADLYAIIEKYQSNKSIKLILNVEDGAHWVLTVKDGNTIVKELTQNDAIDTAIHDIIEQARKNTNGTGLCDFIYDGNKPGSFSVYSQISEVLRSTENIYWAETDISTTEAGNE